MYHILSILIDERDPPSVRLHAPDGDMRIAVIEFPTTGGMIKVQADHPAVLRRFLVDALQQLDEKTGTHESAAAFYRAQIESHARWAENRVASREQNLAEVRSAMSQLHGVGVDRHSAVCVDPIEGTVECVCGLAGRQAHPSRTVVSGPDDVHQAFHGGAA